MSYYFRICFEPLGGVYLPLEEFEITLAKNDSYQILLKGYGKSKINESHILIVTGYDFETENSAFEIGEKTINQLILAFTKLHFPVNFGNGHPTGGLTVEFKQILKKQYGMNVINDRLGLAIYKSENESDTFSYVGSTRMILKPTEDLTLKIIKKAINIQPKANQFTRIAFDLLSAAANIEYPYSKFITLMMALENLIEQNDRDIIDNDVIDQLISLVKSSDSKSKDSIIGAIDNLRKESIRQAGKRLVKTLGKSYLELTPEMFFSECYKIRSNLVHGNDKKYGHNEIAQYVVNLDAMLRDLLENEMIS